MDIYVSEYEKVKEIYSIADYWKVSTKDALLGVLQDYYECAGFNKEGFEAEFGSMTEDELFKVYSKLF